MKALRIDPAPLRFLEQGDRNRYSRRGSSIGFLQSGRDQYTHQMTSLRDPEVGDCTVATEVERSEGDADLVQEGMARGDR